MAEPEQETQATDESTPDADGSGRLAAWLLVLRGNRLLMAAAAAVALLIAAGTVWLLFGNEGPDQHGQLRQALALLEDHQTLGAREQAREIAKHLRQSDYRDPNFAGAPEFILGITHFRDAEDVDELERGQHYGAAARYLQIAVEKTIDEEKYGPQAAYCLGISLHSIGDVQAAIQPLEHAAASYPPGQIEASLHLQDIYIDLKQQQGIQRALDLNTALLGESDLARQQLDRAYLRRAQIFLALGRNGEADEALNHVSPEASSEQSTRVIRAQLLMAQNDYEQAIAILSPIAQGAGLENFYLRQASFLIGLCHEMRGDFDEAQNAYGDTASKYSESDDGLAANLRRAELRRKDGNGEQALKAYTLALGAVRSGTFSNRWLTRDEFRQAIEHAWQEWIDTESYDEAIELSKHMTPLFTDVEAYRRGADAHQLWAEHLEQNLANASFSERFERTKELRERWRMSGKAFVDLADVLRASPQYPDELWNSAEHYRKGMDLESALTQLTRFINTGPKQRLPLALIRRGEVLFDLHRIDGDDADHSALDQFQRVAENHPSDITAFHAQYMIGKCYLELDKPELAEDQWRDIITSDELTPAANEWKLALFSLGQLLYHTAAKLKHEANQPEETNVDRDQLLEHAYARWDETIARLEEFVKRNPSRPESIEARYLLAKSLQHRAALPRQRLKEAETENARNELREDMRRLLSQAEAEFYLLQDQLLKLDEQDMLDRLGQELLRECHFERAHTLFALDEYDTAIQAYSSAANRYTDDSQVLLAYIQMTNCNYRLGRIADARSTAIQARLILKQMPDSAFQSKSTNLSREKWQQWLEWADEMNQSLRTAATDEP